MARQILSSYIHSHFRKSGCSDYKETLPQHIVDDTGERFHALQKRWGYA